MEKTKKEELERLLMKTPLEHETGYMFEILSQVADDEIIAKVWTQPFEEKRKETVQFAKEVLAAIQDEPIRIGNVVVTNTKAIESLKNALFEQYKERNLNYCFGPYEEVARAVLDLSPENTGDAVNEIILRIDRELGKDMFNYDLDDWPVAVDITPEQVQTVIDRYTFPEQKGRNLSQKNLKMRWVLGKIEMVYDGHTNSDFRLFFDCLDLFGLIDEQLKADWEGRYDKRQMENAKTKYMQSVYKLYDSDHGLMRTLNVILVDKNNQRVDF